MPLRLAAILGLLTFAVCMYVGGVEAGNTFSTTVFRSLTAMIGSFVVGLVIGSMGQKMIDENLRAHGDDEADPRRNEKK